MSTVYAWGSLAWSLMLILVYEIYSHQVSKRDPTRQARFINSRMRLAWAQAMYPVALVPASIALLVALRFFDQPTPVEMA